MLQYDRLGHELRGIEGIYAHPTTRMRRQLREALQARWMATTDGAR